jgi:hypothetical protein
VEHFDSTNDASETLKKLATDSYDVCGALLAGPLGWRIIAKSLVDGRLVLTNRLKLIE